MGLTNDGTLHLVSEARIKSLCVVVDPLEERVLSVFETRVIEGKSESELSGKTSARKRGRLKVGAVFRVLPSEGMIIDEVGGIGVFG